MIATRIGFLWEATKKEDFWNAVGHLSLGLLVGRARRRRIPGMFKRSVMVELRNRRGSGLRKPSQVLQGLDIAHRAACGPSAPAVAVRRSARVYKRTDSFPKLGQRFEACEMFNYYMACRHAAVSQKRFCYAIDGVEVSFKKVLTTAVALPGKGIAWWLPPMASRPLKPSGPPSPKCLGEECYHFFACATKVLCLRDQKWHVFSI